MAGTSNIEWTDATWNPIVGCSIVSPGCTNCYAMRDAWRKHHNPNTPHYHGLTKKVNGNPVWRGTIRGAPESIVLAPLHWRKPRRVFVNSMGDLFHENIPDVMIDNVFAVMALSPQHTFQVLTKRPERMRAYFSGVEQREFRGDHWAAAWHRYEGVRAALNKTAYAAGQPELLGKVRQLPLPNVWLGVSAERQQEADERIPLLLQTPAAVRFVSLEPLLAPICVTYLEWARLDWVIVGGESGPHAREFNMAWARSIIAQCKAAGVACFVKQLGARVCGPHANGVNETLYSFRSMKGGDPSEWPADLRIREFPSTDQTKRSAA